jgi:hypothetical protein
MNAKKKYSLYLNLNELNTRNYTTLGMFSQMQKDCNYSFLIRNIYIKTWVFPIKIGYLKYLKNECF